MSGVNGSPRPFRAILNGLTYTIRVLPHIPPSVLDQEASFVPYATGGWALWATAVAKWVLQRIWVHDVRIDSILITKADAIDVRASRVV